MANIKEFIRNNPVRVAAFVSSVVAALAPRFTPGIPVQPLIAFILSSLGLAEFAQRTENNKTLEALYTEVPKDI